MTYVIGVDEVGRGPIAGPLVVCACALRTDINLLPLFPKGVLKDSKKLTEKQRIHIREKLEDYISNGTLLFGIGEVSASSIDTVGLSLSIQNAVEFSLEKVCNSDISKNTMIFLDGSLKAGDGYPNQETVIKGDETIVEISLASIIAKVYRDDLMKKVALVHPGYGFERHVGYGTKTHYEAIATYGMTQEHRRSFLKNFMQNK